MVVGEEGRERKAKASLNLSSLGSKEVTMRGRVPAARVLPLFPFLTEPADDFLDLLQCDRVPLGKKKTLGGQRASSRGGTARVGTTVNTRQGSEGRLTRREGDGEERDGRTEFGFDLMMKTYLSLARLTRAGRQDVGGESWSKIETHEGGKSGTGRERGLEEGMEMLSSTSPSPRIYRSRKRRRTSR